MAALELGNEVIVVGCSKVLMALGEYFFKWRHKCLYFVSAFCIQYLSSLPNVLVRSEEEACRMSLKVVHINRAEVSKEAEAKAMWDNVLKLKWEEQARERGAKLLAELTGKTPDSPGPLPTKLRG